MQGKLINNSMTIEEKFLLSGIGRNVWKRSLQHDCGEHGREFITYYHSADWDIDAEEGRGRHYILSMRTQSLNDTSSLLMPLIGKAIILNQKETVYYAAMPTLLRKLETNDVPSTDIVVLHGLNDLRERANELDSPTQRMLEDFIWECLRDNRRVFTSGFKPLTDSLWLHSGLIAELRRCSTEIRLDPDASAPHRG